MIICLSTLQILTMEFTLVLAIFSKFSQKKVSLDREHFQGQGMYELRMAICLLLLTSAGKYASHIAGTLSVCIYYVKSPSSEANRFSASKEISRNLWNPKVHYRIHKCPPPVPILSQLDPVHTTHPTSCISILILSSHLRLGLPSGLFPSGFIPLVSGSETHTTTNYMTKIFYGVNVLG